MGVIYCCLVETAAKIEEGELDPIVGDGDRLDEA